MIVNFDRVREKRVRQTGIGAPWRMASMRIRFPAKELFRRHARIGTSQHRKVMSPTLFAPSRVTTDADLVKRPFVAIVGACRKLKGHDTTYRGIETPAIGDDDCACRNKLGRPRRRACRFAGASPAGSGKRQGSGRSGSSPPRAKASGAAAGATCRSWAPAGSRAPWRSRGTAAAGGAAYPHAARSRWAAGPPGS